MALSKDIDKLDKKMKQTEEKMQELEHESVAMQILHYAKEQSNISNTNLLETNKRLVCVLTLVTILWFVSIAGFIYYVTQYGTAVTTEDAITEHGGNACIGNNCFNGDIGYGESKKSN